MQRLTRLKDEALKKAPVGGSPTKNAERSGRRAIKTADKKGRGLWSTIASAVSDAFASATGRKEAERKRKRVAAAGAAGAATAAGAAGVLLSKKKKSRDDEAEREAAYRAPQPVAGPTSSNGSAGEPISSSSDPSA